MLDKQNLTNETIKAHDFLADMYQDDYYPSHLVAKIEQILLQLCVDIETHKPTSVAEFCKYSHPAVEKINDLEDEFDEHDSELETVARECMGENFAIIAQAYGLTLTGDDLEEIIAPREW
ncbi:DUF5713 family protein [Moraxella oblonga]|uniref:DUF5713 family protein n=1 Tax=Moraxella oblonga TaxID=200413 RepID=UPI00082D257E|nr:DUF5713 family protein [Moraxella oblonga]